MGSRGGLYIQMLGAFRITPAEGTPVELAPNQATILLARLLLEPTRAHGREELAELLWPDEDPEVTRSRMRQIIHRVRAVIEQAGGDREALSTTTATVQLRSPLIRTDIAELDQALSDARVAAAPSARLEALRRADALYQGDLLPGFYEDFIIQERDRRAEQRRQLLLSLATTAEMEGGLASALEAAERAVEPDDEDGQALVLRLKSALQRSSPPQTTREPAESPRDGNDSTPGAAGSDVDLAPPVQDADGGLPDPPTPDLPRRPLSEAEGEAVSNVPRARWRAALLAALLLAGAMTAGGLLQRKDARRATTASAEPGRADLRWVASYRPRPGDGDSEPVRVLGDLDRGCFVTGFVQTLAHDTDYLTIRFGPNGEQLWQDHFNGPGDDLDRARDMAMDSAGNLYVTGESDSGRGNGTTRLSGLDFATIKYDSAGKRLWVRPWDSGLHGEDRPCAVVAGRNGSVYVAGSSRKRSGRVLVVVKYDAHSGDKAWEHRLGGAGEHEAHDLIEDGAGNVYLAAQVTRHPRRPEDTDWLTVKLDAGGKEVWAQPWGEGNGRADRPLLLAMDPHGGVVVAGEDHTLSSLSDIVVVGYSPGGAVSWMERYGAASGGRDVPTGLAADARYNIYVSGESHWPDHTEAVCLKITKGDLVWARPSLGPAGGASAAASGLALGPDGLVTTVGRFGTTWERRDLFTARYRPDGTVAWGGTYPAELGGTDRPACVAPDSMGEVLVASRTRPRGTLDMTVFRYASRGLW